MRHLRCRSRLFLELRRPCSVGRATASPPTPPWFVSSVLTLLLPPSSVSISRELELDIRLRVAGLFVSHVFSLFRVLIKIRFLLASVDEK